MKRHAPATLRNREAIADILAEELPESGTVLEVASGSGEHVVFFAEKFRHLEWQPSDPDAEALASIAAYRAEFGGHNVREALMVDAQSAPWPIEQADAILCINMVHISPWDAAAGLFENAAKLLKTRAPLILYGPYFEDSVEPAPSNLDFDKSLRSRNPKWGIRDLAKVNDLAASTGFSLTSRCAMPANNLMLIYRRA
ncbi:MAG: DUF938 domain-containing protein [Erythrobacter sp.]